MLYPNTELGYIPQVIPLHAITTAIHLHFEENTSVTYIHLTNYTAGSPLWGLAHPQVHSDTAPSNKINDYD